MPEVLVVDDDRGVRRSLSRALGPAGFAVREAADGLTALDEITAEPPDAVVLDAGLADAALPGTELVRRIRAQNRTLPVCLLAGRMAEQGSTGERTTGLTAGADDYLEPPFSIGELARRLHALLRPRHEQDQRPVLLGELVVEPSRRTALRRGRDLHLTGREFGLLAALARHSGRVLTRDQLLDQVWGYTWDMDRTVVDVFVGSLRKKLEAAGEPRLLNSAAGLGFVLHP
ncbi:response regulator transcription factor [Micromonosporaceae bacterium Da 78-11]